MTNFAIIGVGGYIAPRHLRAIKEVGGNLVAACDVRDSVGILDQFGYGVGFYTEPERFERHLERLGGSLLGVDYLSVCTPNYLHNSHIQLGLKAGCNVICEKPLTLHARNLDEIERLQQQTGRKVNTVLQLRYHPTVRMLKERGIDPGERHKVDLTYITPRGLWYHYSWKGDKTKSGGLALNIGIHLFDMLLWLFGPVANFKTYSYTDSRLHGKLTLENADVEYVLSISPNDAPTMRQITIDGNTFQFTEGFTDLHTEVYRQILASNGYGIADARPSLELVGMIG